MPRLAVWVSLASLVAGLPAAAEDAEGCKDHPLFNRMPNYHITACDSAEFDMRRFPVGPPLGEDNKPKLVEVEGKLTFLAYRLNDGAKKASGLQVMRNFQNAAKAAGGSVDGEYPDWCQASVEYDDRLGNTCTYWGTTVKFRKGDREVWAYVQLVEEDYQYGMQIVEREAMKQDIVANELLDKINQEGFIALYINFDTGKASIKPDSAKTLDEVAAALKSAPDLKLEVAGHTDNVGTAEANLKLSDERAKAVVAALSQRGIDAKRLTPKGYGQTAPAADNRSEEGRAKNRRVELVKK